MWFHCRADGARMEHGSARMDMNSPLGKVGSNIISSRKFLNED